jgi:hypothetical protein
MPAASSPGFFTQEDTRATAAITSRGATDDQNGEFGDDIQDVDDEEEEEHADGEEEDVPDPTATGKGRRKGRRTRRLSSRGSNERTKKQRRLWP